VLTGREIRLERTGNDGALELATLFTELPIDLLTTSASD
jgi:hypothetical protein